MYVCIIKYSKREQTECKVIKKSCLLSVCGKRTRSKKIELMKSWTLHMEPWLCCTKTPDDRTKIPYFQHDQREWSVYRDLWRRLVAGLIFHFPQLSLHRPQVRLKFEFAKRRGWREPKKRRSYPGWIHVLVLVCAPIISTITTHSIMCLCRWLRSSDKWVQ